MANPDAAAGADIAGWSGVRGFPQGAFAFDARVQLLRRAVRSIDVQSYELAADGVGLTAHHSGAELEFDGDQERGRLRHDAFAGGDAPRIADLIPPQAILAGTVRAPSPLQQHE